MSNVLGTTKAFECSKSNASVNISNSEWINNFDQGIKLEKGDEVRLLGSFVNEASSGDSIEITDDMSINIQYSPYIKAQTFFTADNSTDLIDIGKIGDLAYSTDSYGIEPPGWWYNSGQADVASPANRVLPTFTFNTEQDSLFGDVYATGTSSIKWNNGAATWRSQNNRAITWGTNIKTYNNNPTQQTTTSFNENFIYDDFKNFTCDNELYVAGLVKKLILPVITTADCSRCPVGAVKTFEDLVDDPPEAGEGMLAGVPKPGMCIATVDIAGATGLYDEEGNAYFQNDVTTGECNLTAGPQSVIGEILAVRPVKHMIRGKFTDCFELLVHNWISPASIRNKPIEVPGFDSSKLFNINSLNNLDTTALQVTGNATSDCIIQVHGSGETTKNYNTNTTFNNINGSVNKARTTLEASNPSNNNGLYSGSPDIYTYNDKNDRGSNALGPGVNNGFTNFQQSCLDTNLDDYKVGYGKPQGLSFLWNGTYGSGLRYPHLTIPNPNPNGLHNRYRRSNNAVWNRAGGGGADLKLELASADAEINTQFNPFDPLVPIVPPMMGAYIICKPQTMKDIVNGLYQRIDVGRADGRIARWWFEYSYQFIQSEYNERHYAGNAFIQTALANGDEPGNNTDGGNAPYQSTVAGIPTRTEYRWDVEIAGRPMTVNWRERGFPGQLEPYNPDIIEGIGDFENATGVGPCDTTDPNYAGDGGGNIFSLPRGINQGAGSGAGWAKSTTPGGPTHAHFGCPFVKTSYETSVNSIYFQDKLTGDCNLGLNYDTGVANGDYFYYGVQAAIGAPTSTFIIESTDINNPNTPIVGAQVSIMNPSGVEASTEIGLTVTIVAPISAFQFTITISRPLTADIEADATIRLSPTATGSITGAGTAAIAWAGDCLIMREHTAKYKVPNGFYTQEALANTLNDRLHYNVSKYRDNFGDAQGNIPTNVGKREQALCSQNTVINGNFLHTYIPDLNYGFSPITTNNAAAIDNIASTKDLTNEIYTYDSLRDGGGNLIFYHYHELPAYNGTTVRKVTDNSPGFETFVGSHTKLYSVPYLKYDRLNKQVHLIRLRGGALNQADAAVNTGPPVTFKNWQLKDSRFVGYYEGLRDLRTHYTGENAGNDHGSAYSYVWRTRLNRNLLNNGGSAKIFCGANNLTVSYIEELNRFSFNNLYTPLRPHTSENTQGQGAFGIDDAVPSAIIGAELTGGKEDMLSGIYINKLPGAAFTRAKYGINWYNNELFDTDSDADIKLNGDDFMETLGYTVSQLSQFDNSYTNADIFIYDGVDNQSGTAIRVGAKITPAINGSNPFANNCSLIAPVQQYFVQVDTDDFLASIAPTLGKNPYYYIGSDFPTKEFFGNDNGAKLPVIGICARNFHSFNFAFDLGASSISFTVDEDKTITSIHTAIYTSDLKAPSNLSKFSSIIYLITKNKYYNSLPQEAQITKAEMIQANYSAPLQPYFYNQAPVNYRTEPPPIIPKGYYQDEGEMPPLIEDSDEEDF